MLYFGGVTSVLKIADAGMKDANDPTIPERVWVSSVSLMGKRHKICVVSRIQRVLTPATIIRGVVDTEDFVTINVITHDN